MTQDPGHEPVFPTRPLPKHHVMGAIVELREAEDAVQALKNAGYHAQDILLIPSARFIDGMQEKRQHTSGVRQALHIYFTSSDAGFPGDLYLEQARRGHQVLIVYAPTTEHAQGIAQVLSKYHVHLLKYFGPMTVTDFPSL